MIRLSHINRNEEDTYPTSGKVASSTLKKKGNQLVENGSQVPQDDEEHLLCNNPGKV